VDRSSKQTEAIENAFMSDEASSPAMSPSGNAIEKAWPVGTRGAIGLLWLIWIVYGSFQCAVFAESSISERALRPIVLP
jgi:hypothetical protein